MPKLGQLETHLIRRVPNLKKMQLEKERLEQVDLENTRLLKIIKKMGSRKTREFSQSSAAENILPLVLQRRKRERKRKNKELEKSNLLMKSRIDKIKFGKYNDLSNNNKKYPMPPRSNSKKKYNSVTAAKFSHRKFRLSNKQFDTLIQSRISTKNSSKSSISLKEKWVLAYKCGSKFQTNPLGAKSSPFLISIYQTTYPNEKLSHKIIAQEKSALRIVARDFVNGITFKKVLNAMDLQVFFGGFKYFHPSIFKHETNFKRLCEIYFKAIVLSIKLEQPLLSKKVGTVDKSNYLNSQLILLKPVAVIGIRGSAVTRNVSILNARVDVKKLMRRINAQYGIGIGDANNGRVEIAEDCFVEYFLSGLHASPRELALFARGGQYHEMLATLVVQMRNEILRRENEERLAASYAIFDKYDEDRSGEIDLNEMSSLISDYMGKRGRNYAPSEAEVQALMKSLDQSGDGLMDREEFQKFIMGGLARTVAERRQYAKKSKMHRKLAILLDRISLGIDRRTKALHKMFDEVDDDRSGFLQASELRDLMAKYCDDEGHVPTDEDVLEFMEQIDENGDMKLSKAEFVLFMLHNDDVVDENENKIGRWRKIALQKIPW